MTSQTLWDMVCAIAKRLESVDAALFAHVLAQPVIGLETGWPCLEQDAKKPWQMWCLIAPGVVVHWIRDDNKTLSIGNAAAYTVPRFVDDPRVPLDNNRKNHYGSKSHQHGVGRGLMKGTKGRTITVSGRSPRNLGLRR